MDVTISVLEIILYSWNLDVKLVHMIHGFFICAQAANRLKIVREKPSGNELRRYRLMRSKQALYKAATKLWMNGVNMTQAKCWKLHLKPFDLDLKFDTNFNNHSVFLNNFQMWPHRSSMKSDVTGLYSWLLCPKQTDLCRARSSQNWHSWAPLEGLGF